MSSDAGPSRKRARVDEANGTPDLQKDEDVWLSDGNIIVIAEDKVAFRVHKSILSLRSEIFCDLFSLPDADAATAETCIVDGCPIVHISDSPDDIRRLFLVLCCGKNYYYNRDVLISVPFEVLASLIRMAHKYAIQDVLDDALSRLKKYYTHDLSAWQDPESRARYVATTDEDAPQVVALAHLTNTPLLLPTALFVCVRLATGYSVEDDGSVKSRISSLSVPEQARLMHAMGYLTQACATRALHLVAAVPCTSCVASDLPGGKGGFAEPLSEHGAWPIAEELWDHENWLKFCGSCRDALAKTDKMAMRTLWKILPSVFDVNIDKDTWRSGSWCTRTKLNRTVFFGGFTSFWPGTMSSAMLDVSRPVVGGIAVHHMRRAMGTQDRKEGIPGSAVRAGGEKLAKEGVGKAQIAVAWIIAKPYVTAPIVGMTSVDHLEDILRQFVRRHRGVEGLILPGAVNVQLSGEETKSLEEPAAGHT
ncbi:hypothetical protein LXA43DRAFT_1084738 [Ganoderma leucocontextum]|nr:hypothetical protein LXA43DRAFT_1084738 [Ganoderma leucocontextum]